MNYEQVNFQVKKLKVGVLVQEPIIYASSKNEKDIQKYKGIVADAWNKIVKSNKNWDITYEFIHDPKYTQEINNLASGKYDILIGDISITKERSELVNFTHTVFLNRFVIGYKINYYKYVEFITNALYQVLLPTAFISILTFALGYALYKVDPKKRFKDALWQTITAVIGEPGALTVFTNNHYPSLIIILITLFVGFFFNILLYAITTSNYVNNKIQSDPFSNPDELTNKKVLTRNNGRLLQQIRKYNMEPIVTKENVYDAFMDEENKDKYDGFIQNVTTVRSQMDNMKVGLSTLDLGFDELGLALHKSHTDILDKLNLDITLMKRKKELSSICKKYLKDDNYLCEL
jgi:ABC-type amino acid transport substrate-binding protein